jgi:hypothetical protein
MKFETSQTQMSYWWIANFADEMFLLLVPEKCALILEPLIAIITPETS